VLTLRAGKRPPATASDHSDAVCIYQPCLRKKDRTEKLAYRLGASISKYPPAEPGALVLEPLKAAYPCRSTQASLHSVNASPSAELPQLGKLRYLLFAASTWCALSPSFVCLAAHDSELQRWAGGFDFLKCQTFAASPAEPGELLFWFRWFAPVLCPSGQPREYPAVRPYALKEGPL
jgi:hypothetical protein